MKLATFSASIILLLAAGCGPSRPIHISDEIRPDGLISISREMPTVRMTTPQSMLGFSPLGANSADKWLQVSKESGMISLMDGEKTLTDAKAEGLQSLPSGVYKIEHKQRSPLWYAPDSYFLKRNLPVPNEGDKNRYLRGALGEFALFVDQHTPIHSGLIWSDDVGGVRLDDEAIKRIYYSVDVGSVIRID